LKKLICLSLAARQAHLQPTGAVDIDKELSDPEAKAETTPRRTSDLAVFSWQQNSGPASIGEE